MYKVEIIDGMQGLIIETSTNRACLILAGGGSVIAHVMLSGGANLSKSLGKEVLDILGAFQADFVAVGTGPGSYTGIRVGAAMAKSLAFGWQVPLIGYCSLMAFRPSSSDRILRETYPFTILVDARMGGFYSLKGDGTYFDEPRLMSIDEVLKETGPLFSPHPEEIQKRIKDRLIQDAGPNLAFLAAECCRRYPAEKSSALEPLHLCYLERKPLDHLK